MYAQNDHTAPRDPRGTTMRTLLHQMRPWPPAWRRPVEDRPPYAVWVIGGLVVWHSSWLASRYGTYTAHPVPPSGPSSQAGASVCSVHPLPGRSTGKAPQRPNSLIRPKSGRMRGTALRVVRGQRYDLGEQWRARRDSNPQPSDP